jgi:cytochrome c2
MNRRIPRVAVLLAFVALLLPLLLAGCGDPDREILARLSESDQARFHRGRSVAGACWTCHDLAGPTKMVGPSLLGVYGRRSGTAPNYSGSPAMIGAAIVWDDRSLSSFLANPSGFVPGNRMVFPGIPDPGARADLLFYLRHVTRPGARERAQP